MSDTSDTTSVDFDAIAAAAAARLTPSEPESVATPESSPLARPTSTGADLFDDEKVQSFDRTYVHRLREEAASHRTARKEAEEALAAWRQTVEGWDDDQQSLARDLLVAVREGDLATAVSILGPEALAEVLGVGGASVGATPPPATATGEQPLTRKELEAFYAEREAARKQDEDVKAMFAQAKALGYNPEARQATPEFAEWTTLIQYATAAGGDLEAGHKAYQEAKAAERQRIIDEYVASRNGGSPAPATAAGTAGREADDAWLEKESGNPLNASTRRALARFGAGGQQVG